MKLPLRLVSLAALAFAFAVRLLASDAPADKVAVLVIGTFHFTGSATDRHSFTPEDIMAPKRQEEVADVVARLAAFKPDFVAIEWPADRQPRIDETFAEYVAGTRPLTTNEVHQIGYRLAKQLGHARIWGVDSPMNMDFAAVEASAKANGQEAVMQELDAGGKKAMEETPKYFAAHTLRETLRWFNTPESLLANHRGYIDQVAHIGAGTDYAGAKVVGAWYERNLRIFANLSRLPAKPGQRIVFIVGQGHAPILRQLFRDSSRHHLVEVADVL